MKVLKESKDLFLFFVGWSSLRDFLWNANLMDQTENIKYFMIPDGSYSDRTIFSIGIVDGNLIGMCEIDILKDKNIGDYLYFQFISVIPDFQRKGFASKIVDKILEGISKNRKLKDIPMKIPSEDSFSREGKFLWDNFTLKRLDYYNISYFE